jgi:hypothetical protein
LFYADAVQDTDADTMVNLSCRLSKGGNYHKRGNVVVMLIGVYPGESVLPSSGDHLRGTPKYVGFLTCVRKPLVERFWDIGPRHWSLHIIAITRG